MIATLVTPMGRVVCAVAPRLIILGYAKGYKDSMRPVARYTYRLHKNGWLLRMADAVVR